MGTLQPHTVLSPKAAGKGRHVTKHMHGKDRHTSNGIVGKGRQFLTESTPEMRTTPLKLAHLLKLSQRCLE